MTDDHQDEHTHLAEEDDFVPDPNVSAYVTTITMSVAHTNTVGPYQVVTRISHALEELGIQGVVVGVSSVELRGDGGLIGL
jgi:hypothetical protein